MTDETFKWLISLSPSGKLPLPSLGLLMNVVCLSRRISAFSGSIEVPGPALSSDVRVGARDFALQRDDVKISSVSVSKRKQLPSSAPPTRQTYFAVVARMDPRQRGSGMPTTISTPLSRAARLCCAGGISCSRWGLLFRVQRKPVTHIRFKNSVLSVTCIRMFVTSHTFIIIRNCLVIYEFLVKVR